MIISASRRTDIPAFYSDWFMNRLRDGYLIWTNPYNANQRKLIDLSPESVDVIVFWTKNPYPLLKYLDEINDMGYHYYFQYTLNQYPKTIEPRVPNLSSRIETFKLLSEKIGPENVVWRYDPIILSNQTPIEYHIDTFADLSLKLKDHTKRVVISFLDFYGDVAKKLNKIPELKAQDILNFKSDLDKLLTFMKETSLKHNFEIVTCGEKINLERYGITHGKCIDDSLIKESFGLDLKVGKDKGQREECLCSEALDIGKYNTCCFACSYCYATSSEKTAMTNHLKSNSNSPVLCSTIDQRIVDELLISRKPKIIKEQSTLF